MWGYVKAHDGYKYDGLHVAAQDLENARFVT